MDDDAAIHRFLGEHPEWQDHVRWEVLPGEQEPSAIMRTHAMEAFIWWAYEQGAIGRPERIPSMLEGMRALEAASKAHKAGICHPETCQFCR